MPTGATFPDLLTAPTRESAIGLVGVGLMGTAMGQRLLQAGHTLRVTDTDAAKSAALVAWAESTGLPGSCISLPDAGAVFQSCRRVILSLPDDAVSRRVLEDHAAAITSGLLVVDTSTGDPAAGRRMAEWCAARGARYVDATVSGSSEQVSRGEVTIMAGGSVEDVAECQEIFSAFAARFIHTGAAGTGAAMKLVTNLVLGLNRAAVAEGLIFAQQLGISPAQALEVLLGSMAHSKIMETKGPKMISGDFTPVARLSQHLKDVRLMLAASADTPLPLSEAHRHLLEAAEAAGHGQLDNSALILAWQTLTKENA